MQGGEAITERPLTITNKVGLHARPAALFVQTAARFKDTKIEVVKDGTVRDAKSMLGVLTLGVSQGTTITVRAEGPHADEAIAALSDLVDRDLGEQSAANRPARDRRRSRACGRAGGA